MVPGDIYIGKAALIQYVIRPYDSEFDIPSYLEHTECGNEVDVDSEDIELTPWDYLNSVIQHQKECSAKCKKDAFPAEDSSTTNAKLLVSQDAVALKEEMQQYKFTPHNSQSKGNPYAKAEDNEGPPITTVIPKKNVL